PWSRSLKARPRASTPRDIRRTRPWAMSTRSSIWSTTRGGVMADPFRNMNANFVQRLQAFIAASGGRVRPGSGWRDIQEQIQLRIRNGCPDIWNAPASSCRVPTAIPGRSNHNHGLAMDLQYSGDGQQWALANARRFGLHFPVQ